MATSLRDDETAKQPAHTAAATFEFQQAEQSHVPQKWHGTEDDIHQMKILGRLQETRRNFNFITLLAFGSSLMVTWEVVLTNLGAVLTNGGSAGLFWGLIVAMSGYLLVYLSLAEMASIAPTSGGQYHWVSEFAPPSCQRYLSYMTGWLCFTGWQSAITGIAFLVAGVIQGLFVLNIESYVFHRWHTTLLTIAVVSFCILFNTTFARSLPIVESVLAVLHFAGLFATIAVLWAMAPEYTDAHDAFLKFTNQGGWSNDGISFMVGLYPAILYILGFDSQVHMSEEVSNAGRNIPRSIMWATYLNGFLGFLIIITLIFTVGNIDEISATPTGYPFLAVYYNATKSYAGTNVLALIVILTLTGSVINCIATASRQLWAFARDAGMPYHRFLRQVDRRLNIPLNAVMVSLIICVLLSLINIGSTAALNAILALDIASLLSSYIISISCLALKRLRGEKLPPRAWTLGRWGLCVNVGALCFLLPVFVFVMFPSVTPTTPDTMNYACLLFSFVVSFSTGYYLVYGRRSYVSPRERLKRALEQH